MRLRNVDCVYERFGAARWGRCWWGLRPISGMGVCTVLWDGEDRQRQGQKPQPAEEDLLSAHCLQSALRDPVWYYFTGRRRKWSRDAARSPQGTNVARSRTPAATADTTHEAQKEIWGFEKATRAGKRRMDAREGIIVERSGWHTSNWKYLLVLWKVNVVLSVCTLLTMYLLCCVTAIYNIPRILYIRAPNSKCDNLTYQCMHQYMIKYWVCP